jgi:C-terminal processing protease CtpA/Prc
VTPAEIVDGALRHLTANYVFPERAAEMAAHVRERLAAGAYDPLSGRALCDAITADLHSRYDDRHLCLVWHDRPRPPRRPFRDDPQARVAWREAMRVNGEGVHRVERLAGNVGLLELRAVGSPEFTGAAYAAAFQLLAGTHALLLDLRRNGGGDPFGAALFCSYLFGSDPVHLNDIYDGASGETRQLWSLTHLAGPRYHDRPVYALCSAETFSGGEDVCYTLQAQRRATVVGETTSGGAHPTDSYGVGSHVEIRVPCARSVNPVTGTNWEGTGVTPDVAVSAGEAFDVAYAAALRHVRDELAGAAAKHLRGVRDEAGRALADLTSRRGD